MPERDHFCTAIDASHAESGSNKFDGMTRAAASKVKH
jgi:hypothetical protein